MSQKNFVVPASKLNDEDMRAVPEALYRATIRAHKIPHQTGTGVIVGRDGDVVEIEPDPQMYEDV